MRMLSVQIDQQIAEFLELCGIDERSVDAANVASGRRKLAVQDELVSVVELMRL